MKKNKNQQIQKDTKEDQQLIRLKKDKFLMNIKIKPNASQSCIKVNDYEIEIWIEAIPQKGEANKFLIKMLSKKMNLPTNKLQIIKGQTSRNKLIQIDQQGTQYDNVNQILEKLKEQIILYKDSLKM